jgi:hypothetical protein
MNITEVYAPVILFFIALLPAILAYRIAKQQGRSKLGATLITFFLGIFTLVGSWIYLAIIYNTSVAKV